MAGFEPATYRSVIILWIIIWNLQAKLNIKTGYISVQPYTMVLYRNTQLDLLDILMYPLPDSNWYFCLSKQIGSKCASLLLILSISVLLQILFISKRTANNIIQSLHGFDQRSFTTALPFELKRFRGTDRNWTYIFAFSEQRIDLLCYCSLFS